MFVYTTCRDCGALLHTTIDEHGSYNVTHPTCVKVSTKIERLEHEWLAAVLAEDNTREAELYSQIEELDDRPPRLLDAAVRYAEWGWPVFPLKPHSKQPATRHGFHDATTDVTRLAAWWTTHPGHNIGLPTGHAFDVIDVDPPAGARSYLELLEQEDTRTGRGDLPDCHGLAATASGGMHLYVKPTGEGNTAGIEPGIDYRGMGGYVVAPPSTLGTRGRAWSWTVKPSPALTGVVDGHA